MNLARDAKIRFLTEKNLSIRAIAEELGISPGTVVRVRRKLGISRDSAQRMSVDELNKGQRLLDDSASLAEVARTLGRDVRTVSSNYPDAPRVDRAERARLAHLSKKFSDL